MEHLPAGTLPPRLPRRKPSSLQKRTRPAGRVRPATPDLGRGGDGAEAGRPRPLRPSSGSPGTAGVALAALVRPLVPQRRADTPDDRIEPRLEVGRILEPHRVDDLGVAGEDRLLVEDPAPLPAGVDEPAVGHPAVGDPPPRLLFLPQAERGVLREALALNGMDGPRLLHHRARRVGHDTRR